jgi:hypothetical protein
MFSLHRCVQLEQRRTTTATKISNDTETQQQTVINIRDPKDSHKTLGTHQNPAGIATQQCNILSQKEKKMIVFFCHSKLPTYKVHLAYHLMYTKSLQFPLGVTLMTYDMANNASKRTTRAVIGAMHLNRSLLRTLAFAPPKLLRLGLRHHYCVQGTNHCKQIIQHIQQNDENGKMYQMIFDYAQLLSGVAFPILQNPRPMLPHISDLLITTIHQFLAENGLNIVIPPIYIPQPLRTSNRNIMSKIMKIEKSTIAIHRVNQCRLFLQVTGLSEITDPQGTSIIHDFLQFTRKHNNVSRSNLRWPVQALPPKKSWEVWKRLICKSFLLSKLGRLGKAVLEESLGCFIPTHHNHRTWRWEQTGKNLISENTFILNESQQIHYTSHTMQHQIKVNRKDILHKVQPILHSYPITIQQSTNTNLVFARPHRAYETFELHQPKADIVRDPYKVAMLKYLQYRPMHHTKMETIDTIIIGITSKQWGSHADFGWCTTYQGEN